MCQIISLSLQMCHLWFDRRQALLKQTFCEVTTDFRTVKLQELLGRRAVHENYPVVQVLIFHVAQDFDIAVASDRGVDVEVLLHAAGTHAVGRANDRVDHVDEGAILGGLDVLEGVVRDHLAEVHPVGPKFVDVLREFRGGYLVKHARELVPVVELSVGGITEGDGLGSFGERFHVLDDHRPVVVNHAVKVIIGHGHRRAGLHAERARFDKLDVLFLGFIVLALIIEALRISVNTP